MISKLRWRNGTCPRLLDEKATLSNSLAEFKDSFAMFSAASRDCCSVILSPIFSTLASCYWSADASLVKAGVMRLEEMKAVYERRDDMPLSLKKQYYG